MRTRPARPRPLAVSWAPLLAILACLALAAASAWLGYRQLVREADSRLATAGEFAARQIEAEFRARLRTLESLAVLDARQPDLQLRALDRRAVVERLTRLYPELVWVGFAGRPGRIEIARDGLLNGVDVSARDWWRGGLRGPFLNGPHEASLLAASLAERRAGLPATEPPRLLDLAVPLRDPTGSAYGVLAAHLDAAWLVELRESLRRSDVRGPTVEIVLIERGGRVVSGPQTLQIQADPTVDVTIGAVAGTLDGVPHMFGGRPIDGDVAISRLGWSVLVVQDLATYFGPARRVVAQVMATGAIVGLLLAMGLGWMLGRRPAP